MTTPTRYGSQFDTGLRGHDCWLELADGECVELPVDRWRAPLRPADEYLISRCLGPTLDVACGPGRFTAALAARGRIALGIDTSGIAVRQTRQRGGAALIRDVFGPLPGEGRWHNVLLTDGNIGIGGAPRELLRRIGRLTGPRGRILVELAPPGTGLRSCAVRVRGQHARSGWFRWAWLGSDTVAETASAVDFAPYWTGEVDDRWFAELRRADRFTEKV